MLRLLVECRDFVVIHRVPISPLVVSGPARNSARESARRLPFLPADIITVRKRTPSNHVRTPAESDFL